MQNDQSRKATSPGRAVTGASSPGVLSRFLALEQRVLLDAAAVETLDKVADLSAAALATPDDAGDLGALFSGGALVSNPLSGGSGAREVLFVDAGVENYDALIRSVGAGVEVHVLQGSDWASQISAVLARRDGDVSAIHLVSHGGAGRLLIGGETVTAENLDAYSRAWSAMDQALGEDGDLLIYGCDVAAGPVGAQFVRALSDRTGADVAASTDATGVAALGGDWKLETNVGDIEAESLYNEESAADFLGLLADGWVQDTEISAGTSGVAITRTTDGKDWKFIGTAGSNKVDIYLRNTANGTWALNATVTGGGVGNFGFDVAAAGNKLAVSAPTFDNGNHDGRVYVYSYNGTNWTTVAVDTVVHRIATGSGRTNVGGGSTDNNAASGQDQFGYSVDIAWDGGTNYRLIVGNPYEDWWTQGSNGWGGTSDGNYRNDAGVAHVYTSAGHTTAFAFATEIVSQQGGGTGNGHLFGGVVAANYDVDSANWWYAVGGDGLNAVRMYDAPGAGTIGGGTFQGNFAWDSAGNNDVSMYDDYMVIANSGSVQGYKVDATSTTWNTQGAAFGAGGAVVYIVDTDSSAGGDSLNTAMLVYSGSGSTWVAQLNASGQFVGQGQVNAITETAVALDRFMTNNRQMDVVTTNGSSARSYHYNWAPTVVADSITVTEDTTAGVNVVTNDSDQNQTFTPSTLFGDVIAVGGVTTPTGYGATLTFTSTNVNYNATTSTYLQTLAVGQSTTEAVTVSITDGQGGTTASTINVTINGVNDAPTATSTVPTSPFRVQQTGASVSYDVSAYFTDVDTGEASTLNVVIVSAPAWVTASGRNIVVNPPGGTAAGPHAIVVRAIDVNGATSTAGGPSANGTQTFNILLDTTNNAPSVSTPLVNQVAVAGYAFSYVMPTNTFVDPDPAPYDAITYTATLVGGGALPSWLLFDSGSRSFFGTPAAGDANTTLSIRVTANDNAPAHRGGALTAFTDFQIRVENPTLHTLSPTFTGAATNDNLGFSTAISEDGAWMVVGAPGRTSLGAATIAGYVRLYEWNGAGWTQRAQWGETGTPVAGDFFGYSLAINQDGSKIVVGAMGDDGGLGSAYCYTRTGTGAGTVVGSQGKITATTRTAGDRFGGSVAINEAGTFVLIGSSGYDYLGTDTNTGAAFMTGHTTAGTTTLAPNILSKDLEINDRFGVDVSFDQNIMVVSASGDDNPTGVVGRWQFADGSGDSATSTFAGPNGTLTSAQFAYDATRAEVLQLSGAAGLMQLNSAVDLGASWSISTYYKDLVWSGIIGTPDGAYNTLTRGTDHQVIINASTNQLGVWNNSGAGIAGGFNAIGATNEVQQLVVTSTGADNTGSFTLTIGGVTTGAISWHTVDATLATRIQAALVAALGSDYMTVAVTGVDTYSITFKAGGDLPQMSVNITALTGTKTGTVTTTTNGTNYSMTAGQMTGWHHLAAVGEGGTTKFYIDGVYIGAAAYKSTDDISSVGNYGGSQRFSDYLDDFRIYDRAISAAEVRNIAGGVALPADSFNNAGAVYVFSTDMGNSQVTKLYMPDSLSDDNAGWSIDVDIYDVGGSRQSGIIVASSIYSAARVANGGAVYVWRSDDLQSGGQHNDDNTNAYTNDLGNGTWDLETRVTSFDTKGGDYFGYDVAVDYDETLGATRMVVGAPFENANGVYSGAVYAFKYLGSGFWAPEKFVDIAPQGGSYTNAALFGSAVDVAIVNATNVRAAVGVRWRDVDVITTTNNNEGAVTWMNLLTQGSYTTLMTAETTAGESYFLPASQNDIVVLDTSATQGQVSFDSNGQLVYTAGDAFKSLGLGQSATDTFSYVTEQGGVTYLNTVQITVQGIDDTAQIGDDLVQVSASAPTVLNVLANDSDADSPVLTVQSIGAGGVQGLVVNQGSQIVYDPRGRFDTLAAGQTATETFTYTVRDPSGSETTATVTLVVVGEDDPVVAVDDNASVDANGSVTIDVLANDSDKDGAGTFTVTVVDGSGAQGSVFLNADHTITYVPGEAFSHLKAGETATDHIVYIVRDESGNESAAMLDILVIGVNDDPVAADDYVTAGAAPVTVDVLANDSDPDAEALQVTRVITGSTLGQVVLNGDGTISYTAPASGAVVDSFSYEVVDALGRTSVATVHVNAGGNGGGGSGGGAAVARDDVAVVRGTQPVSIAVGDNDDAGAVSGSISIQGSHGTATLSGDQVIYTPDASLSTLPAGVVLQDSFQYTIQYADGRTDTATVVVYINSTQGRSTLEDDRRFAVATRTPVLADAALVVPDAQPPEPVAAPEDSVARMALDALVEMAAEDADAEAPALSLGAMERETAKPGLAAMLGREVQERRVGVDALVRHFSSTRAA